MIGFGRAKVLLRACCMAPACMVVAGALFCSAARGDGPESQPAIAVRVYSSDIHDAADAESAGGAAAVKIVASRGGTFSGKVVIAGAQGLKKFSAAVSELRQGGAAIPARQLQVRYGVAWERSPGSPKGADMLLENPPAGGPKGSVPVWLTVTVPADAPVGEYRGTLSILNDSQKVADVPVSMTVHGWTIPPAGQWATWIDFIQSPDTLAVEYSVPMWSEKHWAMIAKSFRHIGEAGGGVVYVPLMARTNLGNAETMVRWIRNADGGYSQDYSIFEKYLDVATKEMGQPKIVCLYAWDAFMNPPPDKDVVINEKDSRYLKEEKTRLGARSALRGKGPPVTVVDPATGKTEMVYLPPWSDPASKALWQPVWKELRERLAKRGLENRMMLGMWTDWYPTRADAEALRELTGGLPWVTCSHHCKWVSGTKKEMPDTSAPTFEGLGTIGYTGLALDFRLVINPVKERFYGWRNPMLQAQYWRGAYYTGHTLSSIRHDAETQITGLQRGLAHLGADTWFCVRDSKGQRKQTVTDRYPEAYWHNLNIYHSFLAPGPDGPVATARYEVLREGVQECEARIAIEKVLLDPAGKARIGEDLARRAQDFLDEQQRNIYRARGAGEKDFEHGFVTYRTYDYDLEGKWNAADGQAWFLKSGWADRVGQLFDLAETVQSKGSPGRASHEGSRQ